jgi:hypothetical protein
MNIEKYRVIALASTNAASILASQGRVVGWHLYNATAGVKVMKLYNLAVAPTVGTSTPFLTLPIGANSAVSFQHPSGINFSAGIAIAITGAIADADTTALSAGDVVANVFYQQ